MPLVILLQQIVHATKTVQSIYGTFCLKPHFQSELRWSSSQTDSTLTAVNMKKKLTTLPEPRGDKSVRVCCDYFSLTEITRLGEPKSLFEGHPTI